MASRAAPGSGAAAASSRLSQMQMRFQQKQQQEREQRRIEMTGPAVALSPDEPTTLTNGVRKPVANGKVRQMFDDRRRGIDRSHPLKPIAAKTTTTTTTSTITRTLKATSNGRAGVTPPAVPSRRSQPAAPVTGGPSQRRVVARHNPVSAAGDDEPDAGDLVRQLGSLHLNQSNGHSADEHNNNINNTNGHNSHNGNHYNDEHNLNNNNSGDAYSRETSSNAIKLNPIVTKKSPTTTGVTPHSRHPAVQTRGAPFGGIHRPPIRVPATATPTPSMAAKRPGRTSAPRSAEKMPAGGQPPPPGMAACHFCGRHFNEDRLEKHTTVCEKMKTRKRKVFDSTKHRVQGTDAEKYIMRKGPPTRSTAKVASQQTSFNSIVSSKAPANVAASTSGNTPAPGAKKNNWRQKHQEFIAAIRAAKEMQAYVARGGKLSDLPPPPPSENPDYVQCPHCMRRFNQTAAERHIPKCANMLHNKPKPGQAPKRR